MLISKIILGGQTGFKSRGSEALMDGFLSREAVKGEDGGGMVSNRPQKVVLRLSEMYY